MGITEAVARFAAGVGYDDLPAHVRKQALWGIIDTVGVMVAGAAEQVAEIVSSVALAEGPAPFVRIPGMPYRASPPAAALVGGTLAHVLDLDDSCDLLFGHPSGPIVPACFALCERLGLDGKQLLAAYAVGVEVSVRVGGAMPLAHYEHGWHATSTAGVMGAAAASGRLLGLNAEGIRNGLGVAASMAGGVRRNFGTMAKPLHTGHASRCGMFAAQLAAAGLTADPDILEKPAGYFAVFAQGKVDASVAESLGNPWVFEIPGIRRKYLPCCTSVHRPVEAAIALADRHDLHPGDIEDVECRVMPLEPAILIRNAPTTGLQGKFSMEYSVARALTDRCLRLAHFTDDAVADPAVRALGEKVRMVVVPEPDPGNRLVQYAEVVIRTWRGETFAERVDEPLGHPARPLSEAALEQKFRECAARRLSLGQAERSLALLRDLPTLTELGPLLAALVPADGQCRG